MITIAHRNIYHLPDLSAQENTTIGDLAVEAQGDILRHLTNIAGAVEAVGHLEAEEATSLVAIGVVIVVEGRTTEVVIEEDIEVVTEVRQTEVTVIEEEAVTVAEVVGIAVVAVIR